MTSAPRDRFLSSLRASSRSFVQGGLARLRADSAEAASRGVQIAAALRQRWRGDPAADTASVGTPPAQSTAYQQLVRRTFAARERAQLADERLAPFVPKPLQEAFDHPQSRPDADGASLALDLLGRGGLALGVVTVAMAALFIALASGLYAPGGRVAGSTPTVIPGPQQQTPIEPQLPTRQVGPEQKAIAPPAGK
jgi:hypothetical protein